MEDFVWSIERFLYCKILPVQVEIFKQKDKLFIAPLVPFSYHQTIKKIIYHH